MLRVLSLYGLEDPNFRHKTDGHVELTAHYPSKSSRDMSMFPAIVAQKARVMTGKIVRVSH